MPRTSPRDRLREALTARLPYKAAALFFALVVWIAVSGAEPSEREVAVRFVPVLEPGVRLVGAPPTLRAVAMGSTRELLKLYAAAPTVHRAFGADVADSVVVQLRAGDVEVPDGVAVRIGELRPRRFVLRFESTLARDADADSARAPAAAAAAPALPGAVAPMSPAASPTAPTPSEGETASPAAASRPDSASATDSTTVSAHGAERGAAVGEARP